MYVCVSVGGYVRACSAAGGGSASPGPGRAGFLKKFQILSQIRSQILSQILSQIRFPDPRQRPFPLWKSIIDRFSKRKWPCMSSGRVFLIWISSSGRFSKRKWTGGGALDANHNFPRRISPDFSSDRVVRAFRGFDFLYTKNCCDREIRFSLHKEFRAAAIWFYLRKELLEKNREKSIHFVVKYKM